MKRRSFLAITTAALALPQAAWAQELFVQHTNDGYLNLREGPGTQYRILQRLHSGTIVSVIGRQGSWLRVALPDGRVGWASGNYLAATYGAPTYLNAEVVRTNDGYLNLRSGPGTQYPILQRLYAGQMLAIIDQQGSWAQVRLTDGAVGWASLNYMYDYR